MKEQILKIAKQLENEEINEFEARGELLFLFGVSKRVLGIESVGNLIKSMPLDQAIQIMKSDITGQPQTTVIDGEIVVAHVC
jgi:hypothetical protein